MGEKDIVGAQEGTKEGLLDGSGGVVGVLATGARVGRTRRQLENQLLSRTQTKPVRYHIISYHITARHITSHILSQPIAYAIVLNGSVHCATPTNGHEELSVQYILCIIRNNCPQLFLSLSYQYDTL